MATTLSPIIIFAFVPIGITMSAQGYCNELNYRIFFENWFRNYKIEKFSKTTTTNI